MGTFVKQNYSYPSNAIIGDIANFFTYISCDFSPLRLLFFPHYAGQSILLCLDEKPSNRCIAVICKYFFIVLLEKNDKCRSLFPFYAGQPILSCLDEKLSNRCIVLVCNYFLLCFSKTIINVGPTLGLITVRKKESFAL